MSNLLVLKSKFRFIRKKTLVIKKVLDSPWVAKVEFFFFPEAAKKGEKLRVTGELSLIIIGLVCASELSNFSNQRKFHWFHNNKIIIYNFG